MRIWASQTWHPRFGKNIVTDRDFGRTVSKEKLPEGMAMFFPDPVEEPPSTTDDQATTPPDDVSTEATAFSATTHRQNLIRVLRALHATLAHFHSIIAAMNIRFIGASLLIVYESDPDALAEAWNKADQGQVAGDGLEKEVLVDLDDEDKGEERFEA
jgi:1D-myo-inositol-tetrakisphosphate 5-kinase/inositol-polyphosphate multikinase